MKKLFQLVTLFSLLSLTSVSAVASSVSSDHQAVKQKSAKMLYVISSQAAKVEKKNNAVYLELKKPAITYFSDRPVREAGVVDLNNFIQLWGQGANSFKSDNPNAYIVGLKTSVEPKQSQVVELSHPKFHKGVLSFRVHQIGGRNTIEEGNITDATVFVDLLLQMY